MILDLIIIVGGYILCYLLIKTKKEIIWKKKI